VPFLHSRAIIHRDIEPDNIIVMGTLSSEDHIWERIDDDVETKSKHNNNNNNNNATADYDWETQERKWHVTLIDFGFARA
jgi:serine/threonine protein kinase